MLDGRIEQSGFFGVKLHTEIHEDIFVSNGFDDLFIHGGRRHLPSWPSSSMAWWWELSTMGGCLASVAYSLGKQIPFSPVEWDESGRR